MWSIRQQSPFLLNTWRSAILAEYSLPPAAQIHTRVLWGMFTGSEPYRRLFWLSFSRAALFSLWRGARLARRDRETT
jgi:hypothetical protein